MCPIYECYVNKWQQVPWQISLSSLGKTFFHVASKGAIASLKDFLPCTPLQLHVPNCNSEAVLEGQVRSLGRLGDIKVQVTVFCVDLGQWWQPNVMKRGDDIKIMLNRITLRPNQGDRDRRGPLTLCGPLGRLPIGPQVSLPCFPWEEMWTAVVHIGWQTLHANST